MCEIIEGIDGKACTKCKELKEFGEFSKNKSSKDGYNYWCKLCCRIRDKQRRKEKKNGTYLSYIQKAEIRALTIAAKKNIIRLKKMRIDGFNGSLWRCKVCQYQWKTRNGHITEGTGCPNCAGVAKRSTKKRIESVHEKHGDAIRIIRIISGTNGRAIAEAKCLTCNTSNTAMLKSLEFGNSAKGNGHDRLKCDCYTKSIPEEITKQWFEKHNIIFEREKKYNDLINPTTEWKLRYDFFINNSILLEIDGSQHTDTNNNWYNKDIIYRDNIKTQYAKDNDIPLIRIPHTEFSNLEEVLEQHFGHLKKE